ncbi:hypothetical protein D3C77_360880 [compost metagenome]
MLPHRKLDTYKVAHILGLQQGGSLCYGAELMATQNAETEEDVVVIYTKWITVKGKRVYAHQRGLTAFRLEIPKSRYQPR